MQRPGGVTRWATILALALLPASLADAQETPVTAKKPVEKPRGGYGPALPGAEPEGDCPAPDPGQEEIIVCGFWEEGDQFRVQSTSEIDPNSKEAQKDPIPRAPDFEQSCAKNPGGACIKFGSVPPPAYFIDFDELPEAPEGSDADKIAKGEMRAP